MNCIDCGRKPEPTLFRRVDTGKGFEVFEQCSGCGGNARGDGVWISEEELKTSPKSIIPIAPKHNPFRKALNLPDAPPPPRVLGLWEG